MTTLSQPLAQSFRRRPGGRLDIAKLWAARISQALRSTLDWLRLSRRILWFEVRCIPRRMSIAREAIAGLEEGTYDLGPMFEESTAHGGLVRCIRTEQRILDEQLWQQSFPWATDSDHRMFVLGWESGAAWGKAFASHMPCKTEKADETCECEVSVVSAKF